MRIPSLLLSAALGAAMPLAMTVSPAAATGSVPSPGSAETAPVSQTHDRATAPRQNDPSPTDPSPTDPNPTDSASPTDASGADAAASGQAGDSLMIGILPDTQFHARYATEETGNPYRARYGSEPYDVQTRWLAESQADFSTDFVMHLGDVVDQAGHEQQWEVADKAMGNLEDGGLPYAILAGNHDVGRDFAEYRETFPASRIEAQPTFGGVDPSGLHSWHTIRHQGHDFIVLSLSWDADDAALNWANGVLDAHPDTPTILNSHQLINISADASSPEATDFGERVWERVIRSHDQIFLTFNGHHHGAMTWQRTNDAGNSVTQVLMDHQMAYMGGNGYLGMLELDIAGDEIRQTTFSPWVMEKPAETLEPLDRAQLDGPYESFTLDFDFDARFPQLADAAPAERNATAELRSWIASSYDEPAPIEYREPTGPEDYPHVEGTLAHWKMPTGQAGSTLPAGSTIEDAAGSNDLTRAALNTEGITGAREEDVTAGKDHPRLSANAGSVCFAGARKDPNTASYFTTAADAPLNAEEFGEGFTMETFVKVDPAFTVDDNAWMAWLSRDGMRANMEGYSETEGEEPPLAFALSSLREVQFSFVDSTAERAEASAWSGEIVNYTEWMHVAIVNDAQKKETVMYVDGVPMLRNAPGTVGIGADDAKRWILGAGSYAGARQSGFLGCVGETRIVDHALAQDEWLTARADAGSEPSESPSAEPSESPSTEPSTEPSGEPSSEPSGEPSFEPTARPSEEPDGSGDQDGSGDGDRQADDGTRQRLPRTGGIALGAAALGAALIGAGLVARGAAQRRRSVPTEK